MLIFGGADRGLTNQLWSFTPANRQWQLVAGPGAPTLSLHGSAWDEKRDQMLTFGGSDSGVGVSNKLWAYRATDDRWLELRSGGPLPTARDGHAVVWDPIGEDLFVFGGKRGEFTSNLGDLWAYSAASNTWRQLQPEGPAPSPRQGSSAVWDTSRRQMLLFGGWDFGSGPYMNDLWRYDPARNSWRQLEPAGQGPPGRMRATAVWDAAGDRMLVYGGCCGPSVFFDDVWSYTPASDRWELLGEAGTPARNRHSAAWEPSTGRMLIFGGVGSCLLLNDLWAFDPSARRWGQWIPARHDLQREGQVAATDVESGVIYLFGGCSGARLTNELTQYRPSDSSWTHLRPVGALPPGRTEHGLAWDPKRKRLLVFGGVDGTRELDDLWSYDTDSGRWQLLDSARGPAPRRNAVVVLDAHRERLLVFGGSSSRLGFFGDLWAFDLSASVWTLLAPNGSGPAAREMAAGVWDRTSERLLVFGGWNADLGRTFAKTEFSDLWEYQPSTARWTQLARSGSGPSPRFGIAAVWDPVRDQLLIFGGFRFGLAGVGEEILLGELWAYRTSSGQWARLEQVGPAGKRFNYAAGWDPMREALVIVGGYGGAYFFDAWRYELKRSAWSQIGR